MIVLCFVRTVCYIASTFHFSTLQEDDETWSSVLKIGTLTYRAESHSVSVTWDKEVKEGDKEREREREREKGGRETRYRLL